MTIEEFGGFQCINPDCGAGLRVPLKPTAGFANVQCPHCGQGMRVALPAASPRPGLLLDASEAAILPANDDGRLDTGMKPEEAAARAAAWWDRVGRKEILRTAELGRSFSKLSDGPDGALPSGILNGVEWSGLTRRECLMITKAWHHFNVRRPDKLDEDPEAPFILGRGEEPLN